jgi:hypothetical protein
VSAQHTPGSIAALAEQARMMPWEKSVEDVPHSARWAFKQAITADHYLELLEALQGLLAEAHSASKRLHEMSVWSQRARAAIEKATGSTE